MPDRVGDEGDGGAIFGGGPIRPGGLDCDEAVHQLYHYLDGELTEERRHQIAIHLDRCGPCGRAAGFEAELRLVIASRCRDRVPPSLLERVAEAIRQEELGGARESSGS